ncbi:MAG: hypothetical protein MUP69_10500 [Candidatus Atribacteria bacterium]|nr:hypothetical protein [Candidatus Atribacteria bacterium]
MSGYSSITVIGMFMRDIPYLFFNICKYLIIINILYETGMRWSRPGALSLAKVGKKIVNNEWEDWWPKEMEIEPNKLSLEKVASLDFNKDNNDKYEHTYSLPVLSGSHQDRLLVKSLKRLVSIN